MSTGVIAGPELDMADLDAASSSPSVVDLSLNLGPPPEPWDRLALELGGHEFHESVHVSRQNWPRFEPSMSGLLPAGGPEDESSARTISRHQRIDRTEASATPIRASSEESGLQPRELEPLPVNDRNQHEELYVLRQRLLRTRRHLRQSGRPRQALVSILDQVEASTGVESTTQERIVGADDDSRSNMSFAIRTGALNADKPSSKAAFRSSVSKHEDNKETEVGHVVAHFECNICLEMATDPVVTCCGHLFCWSCLYQWLHVHSVHKECPVCKGFLSDGVITPIYGRGSVQDTGKSLDDIPPRPQALRLNSKRRRQERTTHERPDGDVRLERTTQERLHGDASGPGGLGMSEPATERSELEGSNGAEVRLNRIRAAQMLPLLDETSSLRQRITGRRGGAFQSSSMIGATAQGGLNSISLGTQGLEHHRGQTLAWMHMNRIETSDSLSVLRARMEGLREDLANIQRSIQISSSLPGLTDTSLSEEGTSSRVLRLPSDVSMPPPRIETTMQRHSTNVDVLSPQQSSPESPQALWREWHRAVSGASTSFDTEPGSLHARKRRRLN